MRFQEWQFVSKLVVRRTGFPFEMLNTLAFQESSAHIDRLLSIEEAAHAEKQALLSSHFKAIVSRAHQEGDKAGLRLLTRCRSKIAKGRISPQEAEAVCERWPGTAFAESIARFAALTRQAQELEHTCAEIFARELAQQRRKLQTLISDSDVAEAVFISNPDVFVHSYHTFVHHNEFERRPAHIKQLERRFMAYLQRFAAKNDTASFFGPMNYARFACEQDEPLMLRMTPGKYSKRMVFYSFWMVSALADTLSQEPSVRPLIVPRLHPLCQLTADGVSYLFSAHQRKLPAALLQLAREIDGHLSLGELAARRQVSVEELFPQIQQLVRLHIVLFRIEIPSTIFNPFAYLKQFVLQLPGSCAARENWLSELQQFERWIDAFTDADLEERMRLTGQMEQAFSRLTGQQARRFSGQMYADRTLYYEECAGTMQVFAFGKAFCEDFYHRLKPVMDLCAAYGEMLRDYYQRIGKQLFATIAREQEEIPYTTFIRGIRSYEEAGTISYDDPTRICFQQTLSDLVRAKQNGSVARLEEQDLRCFQRFNKGRELHISPDLMFAASSEEELRRGHYQLVLGEMHQFISMWGSQFLFDPEREQVAAEVERILETLPAYQHVATVLQTRRHKGLLHEAFPGKLVQLLGKPSDRARSVLALSDLVVRMRDDELVLVHKPTDEALTIYNSGDENLHLWIFALPRVMSIPVSFERHTPRIEINGVVYQREHWHLARAEVLSPDAQDTDFAIFRQMRAAQRRHNLPRRGFVRIPGEKKPYFIDFDNFFTVELLYQQLKHCSDFTLVEMLPDADQLWLKDQAGSYCLEVRGTAFRHPTTMSESAQATGEASVSREKEGGSD